MAKDLDATPGSVAAAIDLLRSGDRAGVARAHQLLQEAVLGRQGCLRTHLPQEVDWAGAVWDGFVGLLGHDSNLVRAIAGQMLSNLAQSAAPNDALRDMPKVFAVTGDEKFVTARHVLQSVWKFGLSGRDVRKALLEALDARYRDCAGEKNATLIRFDIVSGLRALFDRTDDQTVMETAIRLISLEDDAKYRRKYEGVWRDLTAR